MANASLATQYRPQDFAEVVGQDMVKSILSKACAQDKVAPAYLLSGTRGVGKTTVARIFAKALNCRQAPTAEPCNTCDVCQRITQGSFVDVVEIDGASNRGIDDIRRLREAVGYAPLEGRYKVIIIDEVHMLTREAFNALLKTLEEPPSRVVFLMATTEQHKLPPTILSRCQHFVFRQVPEQTLEKHLANILEKENQPFEIQAVKLIAGRATGSVRDGMSLLGQALAFLPDSDTSLSEAKVREVLGLAGIDLMDSLLTALKQQDALNICKIVEEILAQGVDMTFFLKEFTSLWRNLFVLQQAGTNALPDISPQELDRLTIHAQNFSITYIHAAWQMTLDNQRRILQSLEPAVGLELLLLNLTFLPRLLPISDLQIKAIPENNTKKKQPEAKPPFVDGLAVIPETTNGTPPEPMQNLLQNIEQLINETSGSVAYLDLLHNVKEKNKSLDQTLFATPQQLEDKKEPSIHADSTQAPTQTISMQYTPIQADSTQEFESSSNTFSEVFSKDMPKNNELLPEDMAKDMGEDFSEHGEALGDNFGEYDFVDLTDNFYPEENFATLAQFANEPPQPSNSSIVDKTWTNFCSHCEENNLLTDLLPFLRQCEGELKSPITSLELPVEYVRNQLCVPKNYQMIKQNLNSYFELSVEIDFTIAPYVPINIKQAAEFPLIQKLEQEFNATILECWESNTNKGV